MSVMPEWTALPAGLIISIAANLTGIGGGVLLTPFFIIALGIDTHSAVFLSLSSQIIGLGSGTIAYGRKKKIDIPLAVFYGFVSFPGVALGAYLSKYLSDQFLDLALGFVCLWIAFTFVLAREEYGKEGLEKADRREAKKLFWAPMLAAISSGLLAVGIGSWLIPIMRSRLKLSMSNAVATGIMIMFVISVCGSLLLWFFGAYLPIRPLIWTALGVLLGGQIAVRISGLLPEYRLKELFIFLLLLSGIHILLTRFKLKGC
jgi:hypothetical protein